MSTGKKTVARKQQQRPKKEEMDQTDTTTEQEVKEVVEPRSGQGSSDSQTVKDWTRDSAPKEELISDGEETPTKSCTDFDRNEINKLGEKHVCDLTTEELIKVLICRGEADKNPVVSGGSERLLKQINRERIGKQPNSVGRFEPENTVRTNKYERRDYNNNNRSYNNRDNENSEPRQNSREDRQPREERQPRKSSTYEREYKPRYGGNDQRGGRSYQGGSDRGRSYQGGSDRGRSYQGGSDRGRSYQGSDREDREDREDHSPTSYQTSNPVAHSNS